MIFKKIASYLMFKKQGNGEKQNLNLRVMHGINRISILMFLMAIIVMFVKFCK
jgi:hypothetical protein